ncbi:PIN domain-containing protein [Pyrodictium abyssi]|uniref:PIN domain-containing protein n=1 Tax=Pyrodictium abyssi TaxID=54256 RepID=A0ABN6ZPY8_9CREN|nr:hypothetical protein PABY_00470 [Pyrodictium abyssi]
MAGPVRALLDTSYFLPVFGVAVEGLEPSDLLAIRRYALRGKLELYYAEVMWLELVPKVYREAQRRGYNADAIVEQGAKSIMKASYLKRALVDWKAVRIAYEMRRLGHRDMIDNMLYGIASSQGLVLVTMDRALAGLARDRAAGGAKILDHNELLKMLQDG